MKKFTKILIALGAAGIAKYIYDHVDIVTDEELEEKIKKEAEVIAKEKACDKMNKITMEGSINPDKETLDLNEHSGHYTIGFCDHVYYDNPYNVSKIYLDKNGCPQAFEFENEKDRNNALEAYYACLKRYNCIIPIRNVFNIAGLVFDDYHDFKDRFIVWDPENFIKANAENAIPKTINFGEFERFHDYKKECSK